MTLIIIPAYDHPSEVAELFAEYTKMLIDGDPVFKEYLAIQNYDQEILHLEDKYGMPEGRLYLAYLNEELVGCIGLRKMDEVSCEMKRLYIRKSFRGSGLGKILVEKIIQDAKEIGYKQMLLDTLPFLPEAIGLYKKFGFWEISCYNDSPMEDAIYMKLEL